jgi:peptidoglycan/xylan/chitin deacetylase (PgdA/CDA1 family)
VDNGEFFPPVPILLYHRVAAAGPAVSARFRVAPAVLDEQLAYLAAEGYHGVTLDEWEAVRRGEISAERAVLLTFDDAYADFGEHAWPILRRHGFPATVFVVADRVGRTNDWDRGAVDLVPLLDWDALAELSREGVCIGAHTLSHPVLTELPPHGVVREIRGSIVALEDRLQIRIGSFAYPYGVSDQAVRAAAWACGVRVAVVHEQDERAASFSDDPLALPRLEVHGSHDLAGFIHQLRRGGAARL